MWESIYQFVRVCVFFLLCCCVIMTTSNILQRKRLLVHLLRMLPHRFTNNNNTPRPIAYATVAVVVFFLLHVPTMNCHSSDSICSRTHRTLSVLHSLGVCRLCLHFRLKLYKAAHIHTHSDQNTGVRIVRFQIFREEHSYISRNSFFQTLKH